MEPLLSSIGHTPLLQLSRAEPGVGARLFAKLEKFNPGGSLKDRVVLHLLGEAEKEGLLKPGGKVVAATTGNSGIALAWIGNIKGHPLSLMMPENYSAERRHLLEACGASVTLTPASEGMAGALERASAEARATGAFFFNQFESRHTARAQETTLAEILPELQEIHAFVAGIGTGSSLMGIGSALKKRGALLVAVQPASEPHRIEGIGLGFQPRCLDASLIDQTIAVTDEEAYAATRTLARREGVLVGMSSGAAFVAACKVGRRLGPGKNVLTIFPDGGERYFSLDASFEERTPP